MKAYIVHSTSSSNKMVKFQKQSPVMPLNVSVSSKIKPPTKFGLKKFTNTQNRKVQSHFAYAK